MNIIERDEQLVMANERLADVPQFAMPARYGLRWYQPGDVDTWVDMHRGIQDQIKVDAALFVREYGDDEERLATCMAFLLNPWKEPIGTSSTWAAISKRMPWSSHPSARCAWARAKRADSSRWCEWESSTS